jgi:tRNA nucleotidyltransferase (CCA-adding enzyme)
MKHGAGVKNPPLTFSIYGDEMTQKPEAPQEARKLAETFRRHGLPLYIVGGWVRNALIGLPHSDVDVCSAALPEEVQGFLAGEVGVSCHPKSEKLGTLEIRQKINEQVFYYEYSAFRKESYGAGGNHTPEQVWFTRELEEDAFRRDFSVNALYLDILSGEIADPAGGLADLERGVMRTTSPDAEWIIKDDGLRILRMVRLACELGFFIDATLYRTAKRLARLLDDLSKERVRDELSRILLADACYGEAHQKLKTRPHERGLKMLRDLGALGRILPAMMEGKGVGQREDFHAFDVLTHGIMSCSAAPPMLTMRLAALLHDIGKPAALRNTGNMYGHDELGESLARKALGREGLRYDNDTVDAVCALIRLHMYDLDNRAKPDTVRKRFLRIGEDMAGMLITLRRADVTGSGRTSETPPEVSKWEAVLEDMRRRETPWHPSALALTGEDIMRLTGRAPSPEIGRIKEAMHEYAALNPEKNTRPALEAFVKRYMKGR